MVSKENYDCSSGDHLFSKILNESFKAFKSKTSLRKNQLNYQGMQCPCKIVHGRLYRWTDNSFPFFFIPETSRDIKKNVLTSFEHL